MASWRVTAGILITTAAALGALAWLDLQELEQSKYTVVSGDTLWAIAKKHDVTIEELRAWNLLGGDRIDVGQILIIKGDITLPEELRVSPAKKGPTTRARSAVSSRPAPKECLAPPELSDNSEELEIVGSVGLAAYQLRDTMSSFLKVVPECVAGDWPEGVVDLEITVECNGTVKSVSPGRSNGLDNSTIECATQHLLVTEFPAHDMPDGFTFHYPLTFSP